MFPAKDISILKEWLLSLRIIEGVCVKIIAIYIKHMWDKEEFEHEL